MENPEEILHSLEEFSKMKPKDIPRELEEYLCFVAKTGDPVYQWATVKSLFREKLINVITDFYESCPSVDIPPCPNVDLFNYDIMKSFILEKLDTFAAAPFTVQRICELLTTPRKEYNRIDKYMRALEKNILVVSTVEPGGRRSTENGDAIMNGLESEHVPETSNCSSNSNNEINVEEMDETPQWQRSNENQPAAIEVESQEEKASTEPVTTTSGVICRNSEEPYVSIEPVEQSNTCNQENSEENVEPVTITAIPAGVQKRRSSVERTEAASADEAPQTEEIEIKDNVTTSEEKEQPDQEQPQESTSDLNTDSSSGIENISPETSTSSPETLQQNEAVVVTTSPQETKDDAITELETKVDVEEEETTSSDDTPDTTKCSDESKLLSTNDNDDQLVVATTTTTDANDSEITSTITEEEKGEEDVNKEEEITDEIVNEVTSESVDELDEEQISKSEVVEEEATPSEPVNQEMDVDLKTEIVTDSGDATTTTSDADL